MGYQQTDVLVYGVAVTYDEARELMTVLGRRGFEQQLPLGFPRAREEWRVEPSDLEESHEMLGYGFSVRMPGTLVFFDDLADFYDKYEFPEALVPEEEIEVTPLESQGRTHYRRRYFVDLVCEGADSRGSSMRLLPGRPSIFGVVMRSPRYGSTDDLEVLSDPLDPRVTTNFERYCRPELIVRGWGREPALVRVDQIW